MTAHASLPPISGPGVELLRIAEHASSQALRQGVSRLEIARFYDKLLEARSYPEACALVMTWFAKKVPDRLPN